MDSQFGFDFGEVEKSCLLEMPPGTWSERHNDALLPSEVEQARERLSEVHDLVGHLFKAGVVEASRRLEDIRRDSRHGKFRCHELRAIRIEDCEHHLDDFIAHCRVQAKADPLTDRIRWKVREAFDCSTFAVHVENIGTLRAQRWRVNGEMGLNFLPGPRGTFFLDGYEDDMQSIALPYDVWGPTYAADKLAVSHRGIASVPTFRYRSREYFVSGTTSGGIDNAIHGTAWRLCLPEQWHGERYSYHSLGLAANAGTRQRGDQRGMVVLVRGREFIVEGAVLVYDSNGWHLTSHLLDSTESDGGAFDLNCKGDEEDESQSEEAVV